MTKPKHPMKRGISTKELTHEEWLALRKQGIGSSDVGAILGLNPFKTPLEIYYEKIADEIVEEPMNEAMEFGLKLEEVVASTYSERTGRKVLRDNKIRVHPEFDFLIANLDRIILPSNGEGRGILEIKTASGYAVKQWDTEVPLNYYSQIQHQFFVTGLSWGEFALLIDGRNFRTVPVRRDDEYLRQQNEILIQFWTENVLKRMPPTLTIADVKLIRSQTGSIIEATPEILAMIERYGIAKKEEKKAEKVTDELGNEIKLFMRENEILQFRGETLCTWKTSGDSIDIDKKRLQSERPDVFDQFKIIKKGSRRFLIKEGKEGKEGKDNDN